LAKLVEGLSEVLASDDIGFFGPQEGGESLPAVGAVRLDDQVCQQRPYLVKPEGRSGFAVQRDLKRTQEMTLQA
jgi:hypothetical protein